MIMYHNESIPNYGESWTCERLEYERGRRQLLILNNTRGDWTRGDRKRQEVQRLVSRVIKGGRPIEYTDCGRVPVHGDYQRDQRPGFALEEGLHKKVGISPKVNGGSGSA